ncbi:MAG TPA: TraR/DksA family transcriptional regulator [Candidatus Hydrogenedentes bacterium]|nr:TraR/DksA family transcriptional regulator [Candidatus Hydrogenedentota bacterium]
MNKKDAKKYEKLLLEERDRLSAGIKRLEEDTLYQPSTDQTADIASYAEVGTDNFERETALSIASSEVVRLRDVADALERVKSGNYGDCEGCQKPINPKRLEVFPSARYCIECQSKLEKTGSL